MDDAMYESFRDKAQSGVIVDMYTFGVVAYYKENYRDAVEWLTNAAEKGSVLAQDILGPLYFEGRAVKQNYNIAYKWLLLSS